MLESEILAPSVRRGSLILFRPEEALRALSELEEAGAVLLGADRLVITADDHIQPQDQIDVSPGGTDSRTYSRVRAFLERDNDRPGTVYELVWD